MKRLFIFFISLILVFGICACSNTQKTNERLSVNNSYAARIEKNGSEEVFEVTGEIDLFDSFDNLALDTPKNEIPVLGEWVYKITFNPSNIVKNSSEIIVQFGESCLSINDKIYVAAEGVDYADILEWAESKYSYFLNK